MENFKASNSTKPHILIIGAGITGLLVAQGLKKAGIAYTMFDEENPAMSRPREWTLAIHWSVSILGRILPPELFARLFETQCDPALDRGVDETIELRNSETGEILKSISTPNMKRVSRKKLRSLCTEGIDVLWGKSVQDVTYDDGEHSVTAHFADGSTYVGSILVGADGPKSKVRELLLGMELAANKSIGVVYNMAIVKYSNAEKSLHVRSGHPVNCLGYNPKGLFTVISIQDIPDPGRPETWVFQIGFSSLGQREPYLSNEQRLARGKEAAQDLAEPFRSAIMWIPEKTPIFNDNMAYWVPIHWNNHRGKVTLVGDAAHPLPPFRGQGLNHCILDASNLIEAVNRIRSADSTREAEIASYEKELIDRGAEEVNLSVETALTVHNWPQFMESPLMKHGVTKMS